MEAISSVLALVDVSYALSAGHLADIVQYQQVASCHTGYLLRAAISVSCKFVWRMPLLGH